VGGNGSGYDADGGDVNSVTSYRNGGYDDDIVAMKNYGVKLVAMIAMMMIAMMMTIAATQQVSMTSRWRQ
jgi:hypothetical protein